MLINNVHNQGYTMPLLIEVPFSEEISLGDVSTEHKVFWPVSAWGKNRKDCFQRLRLNDVTHYMFTGIANGGITMLGGRLI